MSSHKKLFLVLAVLLASVPCLRGQVAANFTGVVTDTSGASIAAATVKVTNVETGAVRSSVTDDAGRYQVLALPIGEYEIRVSKSGFEEEVRSGLHLAVGQEAAVDLTLHVGEVKQQITVKEEAPIVNATIGDISGLVGERQVKELPLNGRSYDLLMTLNPGVVNFTSQKTGGTGISNSTTANNFAVSGNRPQQNIFLLNGVEYSGAGENTMQPGGTSGMLLGVDAVREFNVERDSY
ncbi:MAG: carboxypeptidase-like regulatory domain-containing protein, partial [Candidatus Acidiferrum sp.]